MKRKIIVICCLLFLTAGCELTEKQKSQIQTVGETAKITAPVVSTINPVAGEIVFIVGSLLVALAKIKE